MAVNKNPYQAWQDHQADSDYRSTDTQLSSLVRQQLSQQSYLTISNRVNPGPERNTRAAQATLASQLPHPFGSEDLWGWQQWTEIAPPGLVEPAIAVNLLEVAQDADIEGKDYSPYGEQGGASS